jgi:hypothetical protein
MSASIIETAPAVSAIPRPYSVWWYERVSLELLTPGNLAFNVWMVVRWVALSVYVGPIT